MNIDNFINKINKNNKFEIPTKYLLRGGDGIVGNSLESILNLDENNREGSDFKDFELKTSKNNSKAKCTLFNKGTRKGEKANWKVDKMYFIKNFGTGYIDISINENKYGLKILIDTNKILIVDNTLIYYEIDIEIILNKLKNKLKNLLFVDINIKDKKLIINKVRYYFNISKNSFIDAVKSGKITICNNVGSSGHDRGTQYRINKNNIKYLYEGYKEYKW